MAAAFCKALYRHYDLQPEEDYRNLYQDSRDLNLDHEDTHHFTVRLGILLAVSGTVNRNVFCSHWVRTPVLLTRCLQSSVL
jgi:hypothetical protein